MFKPAFVSNIELSFRKKRSEFLKELAFSLKPPIQILDVGGTMDYWRCVGYSFFKEFECTLLNIEKELDLDTGFQFTFGDACDLSRYDDMEFDLVLSNSVINLVGSFEEQRKMANEIRRVGKRYFVQAPNRFFPLDWRTLIPLFHFLPKKTQAWLFRQMRVGLYRRIKDYESSIKRATRVRDLSRREFLELFPEAKIKSEKVFGFSKSFIVYYGFNK